MYLSCGHFPKWPIESLSTSTENWTGLQGHQHPKYELCIHMWEITKHKKGNSSSCAICDSQKVHKMVDQHVEVGANKHSKINEDFKMCFIQMHYFLQKYPQFFLLICAQFVCTIEVIHNVPSLQHDWTVHKHIWIELYSKMWTFYLKRLDKLS